MVRDTIRKKTRLGDHGELSALIRWLGWSGPRLFRRWAGFLVAFLTLGAVAAGVFRDTESSLLLQCLLLGGLSIGVTLRLLQRVWFLPAPEGEGWLELELGSLFICGTYALIQMGGGVDARIHPVIYALVAFLVAFHTRRQSLYFLALIFLEETAIVFSASGAEGVHRGDWALFWSHLSFIALFALLFELYLRGDATQQRRKIRHELQSHLDKIAKDAREFRLTPESAFESRESSPSESPNRREAGSIQAIQDSLYKLLSVAEHALNSHSVALLWLDLDGSSFRVKELRSRSDAIMEKPVAAGEGVLGAIIKGREPLVLTKLRPGYPGLVYYSRDEPVTDFIGVPVLDGEHLRGVFLADRDSGEAFEEVHVKMAETFAEEIVRAVQVERILGEINREKNKTEWFLEASREFNTTRTVLEVAEVGIKFALKVTGAEFAAFAVAGNIEGEMTIAALEWVDESLQREASAWIGKSFGADEGLVGAAIKSRHALPAGTTCLPHQTIFAEGMEPRLNAVKVLPLLWNNRGVGALVVGSRRQNFLPGEVFERLCVMADQAASAMANAQMNEGMEQLATTDGLTGLTNHRCFQQGLEAMLHRSERYRRRFSLVLADIDHFKSVNDTYGHPVGDQVLKRIARVLKENARKTDLVARYGGEEFAILMEEADVDGAVQTAERIREHVQRQVFSSETGSFRCTLSLGVATFGQDGKTKASLIVAADEALYIAKRLGRNKTVVYSKRHDMLRTAKAS